MICDNRYDEFSFFNGIKNSTHLKIMVPGLRSPTGSPCKSEDISRWGLQAARATQISPPPPTKQKQNKTKNKTKNKLTKKKIGHFIRLPYIAIEKARVWIPKSWSWKKQMSNIPLGFNTFEGIHRTHTLKPVWNDYGIRWSLKTGGQDFVKTVKGKYK